MKKLLITLLIIPILSSSQSITLEQLKSESEVREYFDSNDMDPIEGIYDYSSTGESEYRVTIIKKDYSYIGYILESKSRKWSAGKKKFQMDEAAAENVFTMKWIMGDGRTEEKSMATYKNGVIEFYLSGKTYLYKMYPKLRKSNNSEKIANGEWQGNGSGIIISKSGHIVTNHHVIEDVNQIEVEFKYKDEIRKFNAKVLQSDATNDLAIIKIDDPNFNNLTDIPYNFKTRSADVGSEVYALGYPMALSVMGKEIKFTDGKISSKTGFQGNITTYQTTTPIQPGNSGGPLFDHNGNLLGINSSIIRSDIAENVSYTIKSSYILNLIDVLPKTIELPSNTSLSGKPLTEQIKVLSDYVVLIKIK